MKQALNTKLHSQRGASILVALMFFLVCAMVAAVILGSATTNAQKNQQRREEQQVYYSVSSAAKLLRDKVSRLSYEGGETAAHYGCNDYHCDENNYKLIDFQPAACTDTAQMTPIAAKSNGTDAGDDDLLANLLKDGVQLVYQSGLELAKDSKQPFNGWSKSFTIDDGKYTVDVTVSIDKNYTLTFQLTPKDETFRDDYGMTLVCDGKSYSTQASETITCTHNVTLQSLTETEPTTTATTFEGTKKTTTTTVSWEPGMIYKGANSNG